MNEKEHLNAHVGHLLAELGWVSPMRTAELRRTLLALGVTGANTRPGHDAVPGVGDPGIALKTIAYTLQHWLDYDERYNWAGQRFSDSSLMGPWPETPRRGVIKRWIEVLHLSAGGAA